MGYDLYTNEDKIRMIDNALADKGRQLENIKLRFLDHSTVTIPISIIINIVIEGLSDGRWFKSGVCGTRLAECKNMKYFGLRIDGDSLSKLNEKDIDTLAGHISEPTHDGATGMDAIESVEIKYKDSEKVDTIEVNWKSGQKSNRINRLQVVYRDEQNNLVIEIG